MCRADAKAGPSEPTVARRSAEDQQIKATPGITGWYRSSVHSDGGVRHLNKGDFVRLNLSTDKKLRPNRGATEEILYLEPFLQKKWQ